MTTVSLIRKDAVASHCLNDPATRHLEWHVYLRTMTTVIVIRKDAVASHCLSTLLHAAQSIWNDAVASHCLSTLLHAAQGTWNGMPT